MFAQRLRMGLGKVIVLGLATLASAGIAQNASAQMGGFGGFGEIMTPDFGRRDVTLIVDGLRLDETQRLVVETLLETYDADFRAKADEFRDRMNEMREEAMPSEEREAAMQEVRAKFEAARDEMQAKRAKLEEEYEGEIPEEVEEKFREEVRAQMEAMRNDMREQGRNFFRDTAAQDMFAKLAPLSDEWLAAKNRLRDQFVADLQLQLTDDQNNQWPTVERTIRRTKSLQRGRISGESADLFQIVRSLNLDAEQQAKVDPILKDYEIQLDSALKARDEYMDSSRSDMLRAMQTEDPNDGLEIVEKQTRLRAAVRDVNDNTALSIEQALAEPTNAKFHDEYLTRAYPRIFEPTRMERVFTAAQKLEGLEPSIVEALNTMQANYMAEMSVKNMSLLEVIRKNEPEQAVNMTRRFAARFNGQDVAEQDDPIRDAMQERDEISNRYRDQLTQLLTEEQVAMLPMPREGRGGRGQWGQGGPGGPGDWRGNRGGNDDGGDRPRRPRGDGQNRGPRGGGQGGGSDAP